MNSITLNARLLTVLAIVFIGFALVTSLSINGLKNSLFEQKRLQSQHLVQSAYTLVELFHRQSISGTLSEANAKTQALEALRVLRYDNNSYFWVNNHVPTLIMHPYQGHLVGRNLSDIKDQNGKYLFNAFVAIVDAQGEGSVDYLWPKPNQEEPVAKISYVKGFSPWGWIIGTGVYVDDIELAFLSSARFLGTISAGSILLVFTGILIISRESAFQKQALDVIKDSHTQLEQQVAERTELLQQANTEIVVSRDQALVDRHKLEDSEALFRGMTEAAQDAIILINADAQLVYWNAAAERTFGFSANEVIGKDIIPYIGVESEQDKLRTLFNQLLNASLNTKQSRNTELMARRKSGQLFPIELSVSRVLIDQSRQLLGIIRDISKRKRAKQELIQTSEQQQQLISQLKTTQQQLLQSEKLAAIGQLSAGVAHEINNPVGFISSNINSLKDHIDQLTEMFKQIKQQTADSPSSSNFLQIIATAEDKFDFDYLRTDLLDIIVETREGADRIHKIVSDLQGFARASEGGWEKTDLTAEIDSTLNLVRNELKYHCTIDKHYGEIPIVECLRLELNQVIMNLLINASQAIEDQGVISIRTFADSDNVWIEITDNGKGIAPEILPNIFDPFFTTKAVGKGTGLGLSVSYGIIEKHAGTLDAESTPGVGTTFRVSIPRVPNRPADV